VSFRWIEHTAELELELEAETEEAIFGEAAAAFAELLETPGERESRQVAADGADRATLLANWLDELVFLAETEGFAPRRLVEVELGAQDVLGVVEGVKGEPPPLVKAVTYHDLEFRGEDGKWRARVVLDV
jgi:SHS2 domain-containing protein